MIILLLLNVMVVIIRLMFPLFLRLLQGHNQEYNQGLNLDLSLEQVPSLELGQDHNLAVALILVHLMKKEAVENLKDQKVECLEEEPLEAVLLLLLSLRA
jgi:hypothetical protein